MREEISLVSKIILKILARDNRRRTMTISECLLMEHTNNMTWQAAKGLPIDIFFPEVTLKETISRKKKEIDTEMEKID